MKIETHRNKLLKENIMKTYKKLPKKRKKMKSSSMQKKSHKKTQLW